MNAIERNISGQQKPLASGYDKNTTSGEVMQGVNLSGKTVIITGGYSGIGLETAKRLHAAGATVVIPSRNLAQTTDLFRDYDSRLEIEFMDLLSPASIDSFAAQFLSSGRSLHLLINNAGIMACPLARDARGFEVQLATNHFGHYQLTLRLWDALKQAGSARVITVSSLGHRFSDIRYGDPQFETTEYEKWTAYGQSKTANILFSVYLDTLGKDSGIRAYSLHPGRITSTNLIKHLPKDELLRLGVIDADGNPTVQAQIGKTIPQGAATTLFCATSPLLNGIGGVYCENGDVASVLPESTEPLKITGGVLPYAVDYNNAEKLWELTERSTGVTRSNP